MRNPVSLPADRARRGRTQRDQGRVAAGDGEHILLVDDEVVLLDVYKRMLEHIGYTITAVSTPEDALKLLRANPTDFELIMTDHAMPEMTGMKLAEEVRTISPDVPILLASGRLDSISLERARSVGIREIVSKPASISQLSDAINRALNGYRKTKKTDLSENVGNG